MPTGCGPRVQSAASTGEEQHSGFARVVIGVCVTIVSVVATDVAQRADINDEVVAGLARRCRQRATQARHLRGDSVVNDESLGGRRLTLPVPQI